MELKAVQKLASTQPILYTAIYLSKITLWQIKVNL